MERVQTDLRVKDSSLQSTQQSITVSKETFSYLKCLQQTARLWECVYGALELNYGWQTAQEIMEGEYLETIYPVREMIEKYMCASISNNVCSNDEITEI